MSPRFGVSVPYFHGGYSEGHFEVLAMSGRGSLKSKRYLPTTNKKPSETMFQRVLLDFVLKTFGLGAENESLTCVHPSFWDRKSCDFLGLLLSSAVTVLTVFRVRNMPPCVLLKILCCSYLYKGNKIILTYKL